MSIIMKPGASEYQIQQVVKKMKSYGVDVHISKGKYQTFLGAIGKESKIDFDTVAAMEGVERPNPIQMDVKYPLSSRAFNPDDKTVIIGGEGTKKVEIGAERPVYIAGPCAVESKYQMRKVAEYIAEIREKDSYAQYMLRGGAWKPRTNPHTFSGLEEKGIKILKEVRDEFEIPVVTEGMREAHMPIIAEHLDAIQIGARHMQAFELIKSAGKTGIPIIFKKGTDHEIEEYLQANDHIIVAGNGKGSNIVLCPRGSYTKDKKYIRNRPDLEAIPVLKNESYFPVIFDPSHSIGKREHVGKVSAAAMAMGSYGLLIEVHPNPKKAKTDPQQQVTLQEFSEIAKFCNEVHALSRKYENQ